MRNNSLNQHRHDVVSELSGAGIEIGFGSGLNLPYYKRVTKLYALEPSKELYQIASNKIKKLSFPIENIQASAEKIPLPDNHFDFVISTWTLCSISHPEVALREVFRILKPGGKFSFIEHGKSPKAFPAKTQNILTPLSKRIAGGCHLNRDIEKLILEAGFEIEKLEKFTQKYRPLGFMYKGMAIKSKRSPDA